MKVLLIILAIVLGLAILLNAPELISLLVTITIGWVQASARQFRDAPFTRADLSLFVVGCVVFIGGLHWFVGSLSRWRLRWTLTLAGTLALVLLAIMSLVGVAHQVGWIALSPEPLFVDRKKTFFRERMDLERTAKIISIIADTNGVAGRSDFTLIADSRLPDTYDKKRPWEKFHFVVLNPTNDDFAILWPRDEKTDRRMGSVTITAERGVRLHSADYVGLVIGKTGTHVTEAY